MRTRKANSGQSQMLHDGAPLVLGFADLFDHLGTDGLRYSAAAQTLSYENRFLAKRAESYRW